MELGLSTVTHTGLQPPTLIRIGSALVRKVISPLLYTSPKHQMHGVPQIASSTLFLFKIQLELTALTVWGDSTSGEGRLDMEICHLAISAQFYTSRNVCGTPPCFLQIIQSLSQIQYQKSTYCNKTLNVRE